MLHSQCSYLPSPTKYHKKSFLKVFFKVFAKVHLNINFGTSGPL